MAPFQYLGIAIVSFFFFISGNGLMSSYMKNVNYLDHLLGIHYG